MKCERKSPILAALALLGLAACGGGGGGGGGGTPPHIRSWGSATLIETDDAGSAYDPQIAVDASGNAWAVWTQHDGTRDNIWVKRYTAGSGWGTATLIETDNAGSAYSPQIAVDASGNALAVWHQYDGTRDNIWANRYE